MQGWCVENAGPGSDAMPFADAATPELPLGRLLRLSLFQVSVGMAIVLLNGTLNRVMIVELGVPTGDRYPALSLTPEVQKRRTMQALVDQLAVLAAERPVLALYEDVHWIDPSTLELLTLVIERIRFVDFRQVRAVLIQEIPIREEEWQQQRGAYGFEEGQTSEQARVVCGHIGKQKKTAPGVTDAVLGR